MSTTTARERKQNTTISIRQPDCLLSKDLHRLLYVHFEKSCTGRLLDVGCGNKPYQGVLSPLVSEYIGCDVEQSSLGLVDVICSATDLKFESDTFDTVICTQVLEHITDPQKSLHEMFRVMKKEGTLILSAPFLWILHEEPYDFFRFTKHGLTSMLCKAGFTNIEVFACGGKWIALGQLFLLLASMRIPQERCCMRYVAKLINALITIPINIFSPMVDRLFYSEEISLNYVVKCNK